MSTKVVIKQSTYFDSVSLMSLSTKANQIEGVEQAVIAMGTEMNKEVLKNVGLLTPELEAAKSSDLMIVVKAATEELAESAYVQIEELFTKKKAAAKARARSSTRLSILLRRASPKRISPSFPSMALSRREKREKRWKTICTSCCSATT